MPTISRVTEKNLEISVEIDIVSITAIKWMAANGGTANAWKIPV
jgi:hypothetical protein